MNANRKRGVAETVAFKRLPLPPGWETMRAKDLFDLRKPLTDQVYDLDALPGWRERAAQAEAYKQSLPEYRFPELRKLDKTAHYSFFWNGVPVPLPANWQKYGRPLAEWNARGYGVEQQASAADEALKRRELENDIAKKTGARPVPPKVRAGANNDEQPPGEEPPGGAKASPGVKPPELDPIAYHGPLGSVVQKMAPETEAHAPALLIQALTSIGNAWGRAAHTQGGARIHHANLYVVNAGDSASGRKGEGLEMLKTYVFPSVTDDTWRNERIWSGAASGEGIIFLLRNATEVDPGAGDKRLLIEETEFGGVLDAIKRDGNKLSAILRAGWDGTPLGNLALKNRDENKMFMRASNYHLSINGHITRSELRAKLSGHETANGLASRILWAFSERTKLLPDGGNFSAERISDEIARLIRAVEFGSTHRLIPRDAEAGKVWGTFYREFHERLKATRSEFAEIIRRGDAQTLRLSLIFAVLDCSPVIRAEHVRAAVAVWDYCVKSARWLFCETEFSRNAQRIYDYLELHPAGKATLTTIHGEVFKGHRPAAEVRAAIAELEASHRVRITANFVKNKIKPQESVELIA